MKSDLVQRRLPFVWLWPPFLWASSALAQDGGTDLSAETKSLADAISPILCAAGDCCPPTTAKKLFVVVGTLVLLVVTILLFKSLLERYFVRKGNSPLLGRHTGISLALFITACGSAALAYMLTGCWRPEFTVGVGFAFGLWAIHGIYTLATLRAG